MHGRGEHLASPGWQSGARGGLLYQGFDPVTVTDGSEEPEPCSVSQGGYLLAEGGLYREAGSEDRGISVFLRAGLADSRVNQLGSYLGGGVVCSGLLPGRERDRLGLAVAAAINGEEYRDLMRREETPASSPDLCQVQSLPAWGIGIPEALRSPRAHGERVGQRWDTPPHRTPDASRALQLLHVVRNLREGSERPLRSSGSAGRFWEGHRLIFSVHP